MLAGIYYDGRSARAQPVQLWREGERLCLRGEQLLRCEALHTLRLSARLGDRPRQLHFSDGTQCEVADVETLELLLQDTPHRSGWLARSERRPLYLALGLLMILLLMGLLFWRGIPLAVQALAPLLPARWEQALGRQSLQALDGALLQPTQLSVARQQALQLGFRRLHCPGVDARETRLLFRHSSALGPNAFALPGAQVVLLDSLVALADDDAQLLAVLAHELGHVQGQHALRMLLQSSATGALTAWWFGDLSGLLAGVPAALLQARYSRQFEREADQQASVCLRAIGIAPQALAQILRKLAARQPQDGEGGGLLDSHPALAERIGRLDGAR